MGIVDSCFLGDTGCRRTSRNDDVDLEVHEFSRKVGEALVFSLGPSILNDNVFPLDVAKFAQTLPECLDAGRV